MNLTPPNPLFEKEGETEENLSSLKRRAFEICLAIYRVAKLFPKGEALGNLLREISSKIAAALAAKQISDTIINIEAARVYLAIAREQDWVKSLNFDLLIDAYAGLAEEAGRLERMGGANEPNGKQEFGSPPPVKNFEKPAPETIIFDEDKKRVQNRQARIVNFLKADGPAKTSNIVEFLGDVADRTVRADLRALIKKGIVKRSGNNKTAQYHLL